MDKVEKLIREYLLEAKLMQLATSVNNQPWVCTVWFAVDDDLNIYWFSAVNRRHSEELRQNSKIGGAVALPHTTKDSPRAVQFQGEAEELTDEVSITKARSVYEGRIFDAATIDKLMKHPERPHKFYKAKPSLFVLFDTVNYPDNSRQEWKPND